MFMLHDRNVLGVGRKKDALGWKKAWLCINNFFCLKPIQTKPVFELFWAMRKHALLLQRCRLSVKILSWCPHKDQITGKEDKPIKCWNGKPLGGEPLRVMWNCYKIHRGILAKREEFQLKSGSMPFCTVRMSSHMHKSAHVINWPVWSFSFQKTKQKQYQLWAEQVGFCRVLVPSRRRAYVQWTAS